MPEHRFYYIEDLTIGDGIAFVEYDDQNIPTRQVNDYGYILKYAFYDVKSHSVLGNCILSDQILGHSEEIQTNTISADFFEAKWKQAVALV